MSVPDLRRYAQLLLHTGVNLQPGKKLYVVAEPPHRHFVTVLLEEAYRLGAAYVHVDVRDTTWQRVRLADSVVAHLDFVPNWNEAFFQELLTDDWSYLFLEGRENPLAFEGLDSGRISRLTQAVRTQRAGFLEAISKSAICWCVAALPTDGWAVQVLGHGADAQTLWTFLSPILLLDSPDPTAAWKARIATLNARCKTLKQLGLTSLHFTSPGTDLRVGLLEKSLWRGGDEVAANGRRFSPNLPTEEVFTTPDWRQTTGTAVCTRPVEVMGVEVKGVKLTFEAGRVVAFDATAGKDVLEQFLGSDAQANALGEVALVDGSSRIFQSGQVFHSILLDENAACHIALGNGYSDAVEGGRDLARDALLQLGCNTSIVHVDFMIGSPETTVTGTTRDGRTVLLIDQGIFQI